MKWNRRICVNYQLIFANAAILKSQIVDISFLNLRSSFQPNIRICDCNRKYRLFAAEKVACMFSAYATFSLTIYETTQNSASCGFLAYAWKLFLFVTNLVSWILTLNMNNILAKLYIITSVSVQQFLENYVKKTFDSCEPCSIAPPPYQVLFSL